jgi:uncharacterized repeat protein (TIGR03803 family)
MKRMIRHWPRSSSRGAGILIAASMFMLLGGGMTAAQSRRGPGAGAYSVLYSFQCEPDGANPYAGLVRDSAGNLYGTTTNGGAYGLGSVFKLTPSGTETVMHSFSSLPDAENPEWASLIVDAEGNLYGTTPFGGQFGNGAVFKVTADGKETLLYSFTGKADGDQPVGGLVRDNADNAYGTTEFGGANGTGVVYKLAPGGVETVLHNFGCCAGPSNDGAAPIGALVRDSTGNYYGTTGNGGTFGFGTVFELAPDETETILHSFGGPPSDGSYGGGPTLLRDSSGNLYGSTYYGGAYDGNEQGSGYGTVFKVSASGVESVLLNFNGHGGGGYPLDGLAGGGSGNFYGTTGSGGSASCSEYPTGCGVLFRLNSNGRERCCTSLASRPPTEGSPTRA